MSRTMSALLPAVLAVVLPATAAAETTTFADARQGDLQVISSVILTGKAVQMLGGWNDAGLACTKSRRIRVTMLVERSTANSSTGTGGVKTKRTLNCAEGGPNVGFDRTAEQVGLACPDGTWKRGRYSFQTKTKHLASGLVSIATLDWRKRGSC